MSFFPLKDSFGTVQLTVIHSDHSSLLPPLSDVPVESTVLIEGTVQLRPPEARRPGPTGEIDVQVDNFTVLNPASTSLPFVPSNLHNLANEDLRAKYRYLDLRRTALSNNIKKRSDVAHIVRNILHEQGFIEVETPVLLRSSPEGAREFLVPTRCSSNIETKGAESSHDPLFYALQQSPQQPKQLLVCSGAVDRYYQIAKCFRDEDGRKDRQPEFTQIDMEMAFVSWGDHHIPVTAGPDVWRIGGQEVRDVVETLIRSIWQKVEGVELPKPFRVMTYYEAMTRFGSDKPDTRFGLEIINLHDLLPGTDPDSKDIVECILVRKSEDAKFIKTSRSCEDIPGAEHVSLNDSNRHSWLLNSKLTVSVLQELSVDDQSTINEALRVRSGDDVWISTRSRSPQGGSTTLGRTRIRLFDLARAQGAFQVTDENHFLWITEFPLFTRADEDKDFLSKGRWSSSHHPFTAPMWEDIEAMYRGDVEKVRGQHYDLVLNGVEIGGGSVRVHDAAMQDYIFREVLQLNEQEKAPFTQLLHALQCGAPPHGGIALGFDRIMAIICNAQSIRDVIAFPKTSTGTDLLFRSPAAVGKDILSLYGIQPCS
ncbi:hypothetical protein BDQ17DRAFT_1348780 [Cyathus striatus]|nr:hypothetical protein BDQ17DRAFT_1348780 [Cyathus striatus]